MSRRIYLETKPSTKNWGTPVEVVLVFLPDNKGTPFVTWMRGVEDGGTYWGHYHKSIVEAAKDYESRN